MVVGHDDVQATLVGDRDLGSARRPAIDGHDERGPRYDGRVDGGQRKAVAFVQAARHIGHDRRRRTGAARWSGSPGRSGRRHRNRRTPGRARCARGRRALAPAGGRHPADLPDRAGRSTDRRTRRRGPRPTGHLDSPGGPPCAEKPLGSRRRRPVRRRARPARERSSGSGPRPCRSGCHGPLHHGLRSDVVTDLRMPGAGLAGRAMERCGRVGDRPRAASPRAAGSRRRSTSRSPTRSRSAGPG